MQLNLHCSVDTYNALVHVTWIIFAHHVVILSQNLRLVPDLHLAVDIAL